MLIVGVKDLETYVYTLDEVENKYKLSQKLIHDTIDERETDTTEDNTFLVVTSKEERSLYIYENNGSEFEESQKITENSSKLTSGTVSADGNYIVTGDEEGKVKLYSSNGQSY